MTKMLTQSSADLSSAFSTRIWGGVLTLSVGLGLLFMVGLSNISFAHNAAHDTRHAIGFPCH